VRCWNCDFDNPQGMQFCGHCGTPLSQRCPRCRFENPAGFAFCGQCGTPLTGQAPPSASSAADGQTSESRSQGSPGSPSRPIRRRRGQASRTAQRRPAAAGQGAPEAERRQLTVLFCDLVDSTALAARLDPEELRELVQAYQAACAEVIQRLDGHIAQYLGDGVLVYFGYPQAHEDDAQRAVRAGLAIVDALGRLKTQLAQDKGVRLAVRLGIHTGLVVVGKMGGGAKREQLALGETPNLAARLQGLAAPDTVVTSAATYHLIQGLFECQDLGLHTVKGLSALVQVYRVLGESQAQSRLEAAVSAGLTPLVGRESEVTLLLERWAQVQEGMGQVVILSGEAGIGKSRLVQVVKDRIAGEPHARLECRSSPYHQNSVLYPVIDLWQRLLQFQRDDAPETKRGKLARALAAYDIALPEVLPLLSVLLSLPPSERYPPLDLTPQRQRQKTLEAMLAVLLAMAAQRPLLLIVEDLHWVDPSTLELLSLLIEQTPTARIFTLLTCRPEFRPPWGTRAHVTFLTLSRLPRGQARVMVEQVTGGKVLPAEVAQQIVDKTDGVPLFVEELTKMVLESGLLREREERYELTGPLPQLAIPSTLHDSLMARLDRLSTIKAVAQMGATLGRSFSYELLQAVSPLDDGALQHALRRLVEAELLYQRGLPPQVTYLFKHALIQEAAYRSLLKRTRQHYHRRIAQVLEGRFPDMAQTQPELLAHHYTEAGLVEQATPYWLRAGQYAVQRSAHTEAVGHLTQGLEALNTLPETVERAQHELTLQTTLGPALMAIKGYAAPEVERTYARARELCRQVGETPLFLRVLLGLEAFYFIRAQLDTARELGEQCLALAQSSQDPPRQQQAFLALASTLFHLGELSAARTHLEEGMVLHDPPQAHPRALPAVADPRVACRAYATWTLWQLGYPDQALQYSREAMSLAQELSHPHSLAFALHFACGLHQYRREAHVVQDMAKSAMELAAKQEFSYWVATATIWHGWALAAQGQHTAGIAQIRQGLDAYRSTGAALGWPLFLALLAEAYQYGRQIDAGLAALADALETAQQTGERWYEAELYRLQGELLLARAAGPLPEAETRFHQAADVAGRQHMKMWELRTAMSWARLWQRQGKRVEARQLLAESYSWFAEGWDTADLQEARALLAELS